MAGVLHTGGGDITNHELLDDAPTSDELELIVPYQELHLRLRSTMMERAHGAC